MCPKCAAGGALPQVTRYSSHEIFHSTVPDEPAEGVLDSGKYCGERDQRVGCGLVLSWTQTFSGNSNLLIITVAVNTGGHVWIVGNVRLAGLINIIVQARVVSIRLGNVKLINVGSVYVVRHVHILKPAETGLCWMGHLGVGFFTRTPIVLGALSADVGFTLIHVDLNSFRSMMAVV